MSAVKGRRTEWKSRRWLEAQGYEVVRAAGSKGVFDLIGFGFDDVVLVQVKCNRWPGPMERLAMAGFQAPPNVRREAHRWDDRAREPRIQTVEAA